MVLIKESEKGFTLVELIIVMSLLLILSAVAISRFSSLAKDARLNTDFHNAGTISAATQAYIADKDGVVTDMPSVEELKGEYLIEDIEVKSQTDGGGFEIEYNSSEKSIIVKTKTNIYYPKGKYIEK